MHYFDRLIRQNNDINPIIAVSLIKYPRKKFQIFLFPGYAYVRFDVIIMRHVLSQAHIYVNERYV